MDILHQNHNNFVHINKKDNNPLQHNITKIKNILPHDFNSEIQRSSSERKILDLNRLKELTKER